MAQHVETLRRVFEEMREPWWNEEIIEDNDTDTERKKEAETRRKKKGITYKTFPNQAFVEILLCMLHVLSLIFVPIYLCMGFTMVGWVSSMNAIVQEDPTKPTTVFEDTLINYGAYNMNSIGIAYIVYGIILFATTLATIKSIFKGRSYRVKLYLTVNFMGLLCFELVLWIYARKHAPYAPVDKHGIPKACQLQIFEEMLLQQMFWYGLIRIQSKINDSDSGVCERRFLGYEAIMKMNSVQEALGCCGVYGWKDYLSINDNISWFPPEAIESGFGIRSNASALHRTLDSIPHTCCTPDWAENLYCAEDIDLYPDLVVERLSNQGCFAAVQKVCDSILYILNYTTLTMILFRLLFFMVSAIILRSLLTLLSHERIKAFECLLDLQRPNLPGFDLAEGLIKLKPISNKTQALPGQVLSKTQIAKQRESSELQRAMSKRKGESYKRHESVWEEQRHRERSRTYQRKTRNLRRHLARLAEEELGPLPKFFLESESQPNESVTFMKSPQPIIDKSTTSPEFANLDQTLEKTGSDLDTEAKKDKHRFHFYTQRVPEQEVQEAEQELEELVKKNVQAEHEAQLMELRSQTRGHAFGEDRKSIIIYEPAERPLRNERVSTTEEETETDDETHQRKRSFRRRRKSIKKKGGKEAWSNFW